MKDNARNSAKARSVFGSEGTTLIPATVQCPRCNSRFELGGVLKAHIAKVFGAELEARVADTAAETETRIRAELQAKLETYGKQAADAREALHAAKARELDLIRREQDLADREQETALAAARTLAEEREQIRHAEEQRIRVEVEQKSQVLEAELMQVKKRLHDAQEAELKLRQERESVEARERTVDLEVRRRVDELRVDIVEQARNDTMAVHRVEVEERDLEIRRLNERIQSLQQTATASQEARGEAQELVLRDTLVLAFPTDEVLDVPKGRPGGDVIQIVRNGFGHEAGRILHETKRTRAFNEAWLEKIKADQREARADIAVLVSQSLPRDITHIGFRDGVLVASLAAAPGATAMARQLVLRVAGMRSESETRDLRLRQLQELITSAQFRLGCDAIFHAIQAMVTDLEGERQAANRWHARRTKRIDLLSRAAADVIASLETSAGCPARDLVLPDDSEALSGQLLTTDIAVPAAMDETMIDPSQTADRTGLIP